MCTTSSDRATRPAGRSALASLCVCVAGGIAALGLPACASGFTPREQATIELLSPIPPPLARPTNSFADDPAAAALGKELFFDAGLSGDGKRSCATCHEPTRHFTDGKRVADGIGAGPAGTRNVPSIETAAWQTWFFWDGRADSAWSQATGPIRNPIEMGGTAAAVRERVISTHTASWTPVFGEVPEDPDAALVLVGKAIEAFERTISPGPARFDRYVSELRTAGHSEVLNPQEVRGLDFFLDDGCVNCHSGPLLTDGGFHNVGVPQIARGGVDIGRALGAIQVQRDPFNCFGNFADHAASKPADCPELRFLDTSFADWPMAFKTPSLRNVTRTAPYMHDGSMATLDAVLQFYSDLPGTPVVGHRELTLQPLRASASHRADLIAFLGTLEGT